MPKVTPSISERMSMSRVVREVMPIHPPRAVGPDAGSVRR